MKLRREERGKDNRRRSEGRGKGEARDEGEIMYIFQNHPSSGYLTAVSPFLNIKSNVSLMCF